MSKINELLVASIMPAIKLVGKMEMENVLSDVKEHNPADVYQNTLQGLHSGFSLLKQAAIKSKSRVDDGIIDLVLEAIKECAGNDKISLLSGESVQ